MAIRKGEALDRTFYALGCKTRRDIISLLVKKGECSAGELGAPFNISQPTASKHLKVLEEAGIVIKKRNGREQRFKLMQKNLKQAESWIEKQREFWIHNLDSLEKFLEKQSD